MAAGVDTAGVVSMEGNLIGLLGSRASERGGSSWGTNESFNLLQEPADDVGGLSYTTFHDALQHSSQLSNNLDKGCAETCFRENCIQSYENMYSVMRDIWQNECFYGRNVFHFDGTR